MRPVPKINKKESRQCSLDVILDELSTSWPYPVKTEAYSNLHSSNWKVCDPTTFSYKVFVALCFSCSIGSWKKCFSIEFRKEAYWGCYFVCCVGGHKAIYLLYMKLDSVQTANSTCNLILMAQLHEKMHATVVLGSILQMFSFALARLHILLDWLWPFSCLQVILAR